MNRPQQQFTFIDVNAGKKSNTRTIKHHISSQTNRRKRQDAVNQYQQTLLQAAGQSAPTSGSYVLSDALEGNKFTAVIRSRESPGPRESSSSSNREEEEEDVGHPKLDFFQYIAQQQPVEIENYWPAYQQWAAKHLKSRPPAGKSAGSRAEESLRSWTISLDSASRTVVLRSNQHAPLHIPRIDEPSDFSHIRCALRTCSDFIHGNYESTWRAEWQEKPWFRGEFLSLGAWRESFPLAVEFISAGKLNQAFVILNAAFNVTPAFFKENHPCLLIALLGSMLYASHISDVKLSRLISSHICQLSMAHLGYKHPISLLLKEQMRATDVGQGRTDLLCLAVLDTFTDVFGPTHFVPLSMRFGYLRRQFSSGQYDAALAAIDDLEKNFNSEVMHASPVPRFLAFEKAKIMDAQQKKEKLGSQRMESDSQTLEKAVDVSLQLPVFIQGQGPAFAPLNSTILRKLGKDLLFGSHYALALHTFTRMSEALLAADPVDSSSGVNQDPTKLPSIVVRILIDNLRDEMQKSGLGEHGDSQS